MHGLILAGGIGSRLAMDGVTTPKALAPVGGRPQLVALAERFMALGCDGVTCLVRDEVVPALDADPSWRGAALAARVVPCRTPSSLHTLVAGLDELPDGPVFCAMVDTVMRRADWRRVHAIASHDLADGVDAVLAVTPPTDDDAPLWVRLGLGRRITRVGGDGPTAWITGGVYVLSPAARARAQASLAAGRHRMRAFLTDLVDGGADVRAVTVRRIVDVDHARDLAAANALVGLAAGISYQGGLPPLRP